MSAAPLDNERDTGPLIPVPTTDVDYRVNEAHARAVRTGARQYVYAHGDKLWITATRPQTFPCVAVDAAGWAIWLAVGADEAELGG